MALTFGGSVSSFTFKRTMCSMTLGGWRGRRQHPQREIGLPNGNGSGFDRWESEGKLRAQREGPWTESEAKHSSTIPSKDVST